MYLHSLGHFHPENVITNAFLAELGIDTNDGWITERVGILTRHTVLPLDYIRQTRNKEPRAALEAAVYTNCSDCRTSSKVFIPCCSSVFVNSSESCRELNVRFDISNCRSSCLSRK